MDWKRQEGSLRPSPYLRSPPLIPRMFLRSLRRESLFKKFGPADPAPSSFDFASVSGLPLFISTFIPVVGFIVVVVWFVLVLGSHLMACPSPTSVGLSVSPGLSGVPNRFPLSKKKKKKIKGVGK